MVDPFRELMGDRVLILALMTHALDEWLDDRSYEYSLGGPAVANILVAGHSYKITVEDA